MSLVGVLGLPHPAPSFVGGFPSLMEGKKNPKKPSQRTTGIEIWRGTSPYSDSPGVFWRPLTKPANSESDSFASLWRPPNV